MYIRIAIVLGIVLFCMFVRTSMITNLFCLALVGGYLLALEVLLKRERQTDDSGEDKNIFM